MRAVGTATPPLIAVLVLLALWEAIVRIGRVPQFIVPTASATFQTLYANLGYLGHELAFTLFAAALGLCIGTAIGVIGGSLMAQSRMLEETLFPLAIALKLVPYVAIAPILIVWLGHGLAPEIVIASLSTYFPVLVNCIGGLRSVDPTALEFFQSTGASESEIFWHLRRLSAMPYLFAALKVSVTLSVLGAIVGEYFGTQNGIGNVIVLTAYQLDMRLLFAATIVLAVTGGTLTLAANVIERRALYWHESTRVEA